MSASIDYTALASESYFAIDEERQHLLMQRRRRERALEHTTCRRTIRKITHEMQQIDLAIAALDAEDDAMFDVRGWDVEEEMGL